VTATPPPRRSVVVTGVAKSGQLGEGLALAFAREGARVSVVARKIEEATARALEMRTAGLDVHPFACDLADPVATARLADDIGAAAGSVDLVVHAAGGFAITGPVADSDPAAFQQQLTIGLATAYATARAFIPLLRASHGSLVFLASASALPGARVKGVAGYAIAKSGVLTLMRAIAQEEHEHGVRANAIAPAAIRTRANVGAMPANARFVEPASVVAAIRYLASPEASQVTGQVIELAP
jgi:NAD(P)-dependent dehydrogenase (short-subunit alcohol dehydrogenase family)